MLAEANIHTHTLSLSLSLARFSHMFLRFAGRIARMIEKRRPIYTTDQLAQLVCPLDARARI